MAPGRMMLSLMSCNASSLRMLTLSASRAILLAAYGWKAAGKRMLSLLMFTTRPLVSISCGKNTRIMFTAPKLLMANIFSKASFSFSVTGKKSETPALFTSPQTRMSFSSSIFRSAKMESSSVTSMTMPETRSSSNMDSTSGEISVATIGMSE